MNYLLFKKILRVKDSKIKTDLNFNYVIVLNCIINLIEETRSNLNKNNKEIKYLNIKMIMSVHDMIWATKA